MTGYRTQKFGKEVIFKEGEKLLNRLNSIPEINGKLDRIMFDKLNRSIKIDYNGDLEQDCSESGVDYFEEFGLKEYKDF